jgi:arginyl-tRNA synthetase
VITRRLAGLLSEALERAGREGLLEAPWDVTLERPKRREHGDWSTNVALALARRAGVQPRALADTIVERLPSSDLIERVEVAGPGFINLHLSVLWLHDVVRRAADPAAGFGRTDDGSGTRVNVEFVSANPTGPVNVVSGRHAAVGDTIARLLEATGAEVVREYYLNDAGRQVTQFARSIETHYLRALGRAAELPEDAYRGEYVADIAKDIAREIGDELLDAPESERVESLRAHALARTVAASRHSLERFGTRYDVWTSEATLRADGSVKAAIERLRADGWVEERDGALWFFSSRLGDDKDRVIVRSDGTPTYLASDVAYMLDKFERGFDRLLYVLGAGHHGTLARLWGIADALGFGRARVEFPLVQNVSIVSGGQTLKASKRAGAS